MSGKSEKGKNQEERKMVRRGSYTLEAAVILPLTAAFWVAVLFFFQVLMVETEVQEALFYAGRMTAVEACAVDGDTALLASAEVLFRKELSQYSLISKVVRGSSLGISLLDSRTDGEVLELRAEYTVKLPFAFFSVPGLRIVQNSNNRKWNGRTVSVDGNDETEEEIWVYVTDYGSVYHRSSECSYLNPSIQAASLSTIGLLRNRSGGIYYPCSGCNADQVSAGVVYYTNYGTNYHSSLSCSGLKRTTRKVKLSEVEGLRPCSKCGGS